MLCFESRWPFLRQQLSILPPSKYNFPLPPLNLRPRDDLEGPSYLYQDVLWPSACKELSVVGIGPHALRFCPSINGFKSNRTSNNVVKSGISLVAKCLPE